MTTEPKSETQHVFEVLQPGLDGVFNSLNGIATSFNRQYLACGKLTPDESLKLSTAKAELIRALNAITEAHCVGVKAKFNWVGV